MSISVISSSRTRSALSVALLALVPLLSAQEQEAQEPEAPVAQTTARTPETTPSFPAQIELVDVDVVVTDKKGNPIKGLKQSDFVIEENGDKQVVTTFEAIELPELPVEESPPRPAVSDNTRAVTDTGRSLVVIFDDIHMTPFQARRAKGAVAEFLKVGVREGDRVSLVATGGGAWWTTRMMAGSDELIAMLDRLEGRHIPDISTSRLSDQEAMRIHVYRDDQVIQRVQRRYDTYGVNPLAGGGGVRGAQDGMMFATAADVYYQSVAKNRITLDVIERVMKGLAPVKGRKGIILVSEGFIYDPNLIEFKDVKAAARRANAAIYFVDTRGLTGMPAYMTAAFGPPPDTRDMGAMFMDRLDASQGSESLAIDTGGFTVKNTNDLAAGIQRITEESRNYYVLGYRPTNTKQDGRWRKIKVKLPGHKKIKIRARAGYFAPDAEGEIAEVDENMSGADPHMQAALDSPYTLPGVPMRMTAFAGEETMLGKARTLVVIEVNLDEFEFQEGEGRFTDTLEFALVVVHRESGEFFQYDQQIVMKLRPETREFLDQNWYYLERDFELEAGGYQAKIVVRDKNAGTIGTLVHEFEVPDLGEWRVSSPVLTTRVQPYPEGEEGPPRLLKMANRDFVLGSFMYCQFDIFGAAKELNTGMPHVKGGYEIVGKDGTVLTRVDATLIRPTSLGRLSRLVGAPLNAAPGDYEFILSLTDEISGKTIEKREPFKIVAKEAPAEAPAEG